MTEHITSKQNPLCKQIKKLRTNRAYRYETGLFLADGVKLVGEALHWGRVEAVILREGVTVEGVDETLRTVIVPPSVMQDISRMDTPQGAIALCRMPPAEAFVPQAGSLILDGIQDPGNLGTILRTADAFGVPVVLSDGCADPYGEKTVRASMGAVLRSPPVQSSCDEIIARCKAAGLPICVTALTDTAFDIRSVELRRFLTVIGSEGQGVRQEFLAAASQTAVIPMSERCESLNAAVAAAIVLWQTALSSEL